MERLKQISNEELLELTKKAFEKGEVADYLQGINGYICPVDRFYPAHVPTDFGRILESGVYVFYNETQDKDIVDKISEAIVDLLDGSPIQVWIAYNICWMQIYREFHKKSPFNLIKNDLLMYIKKSLVKNENKLRECKEWQGKGRENGLWDEITRSSGVLKKEYGVSIL